MLLTQDQASELLYSICCNFCGQKAEQVYCRDCDVLTQTGHAENCTGYRFAHGGHRLQRRYDDPAILLLEGRT